MLGPVSFGLALVTRRAAGAKLRLGQLFPWFIAGFLLLMALRSFGGLPSALLPPAALLANALTIVAMAALGLSVDLREMLAGGGRVIAAATLSLLGLGGLAICAIHILG
jgi:uncharacterized membrane protein YadS